MYRKANIKQLTVIFFSVLILVVLVEWIDSRKGNRTFKKDLVKVESGEISAIEIYPRVVHGERIRLFRENDLWMVESGGEKFKADRTIASSLVNDLNQATPENVVAIGKDRWDSYEVTDSLGTRVKLFKGEDVVADLIIGKFNFSQPRKMTSYIRLAGEKEVYGVNGMLGMSFNRNSNTFRDKTVISSNTTDWRRLIFNYPADSSFMLGKSDSSWTIENQPADSTEVVNYFNAIRNLTDSRFAEMKPEISASHQLRIEGDNQMEPVEITGFYLDEDNFILESNQNRGNFFNSPDLAKKIFVPRSKFIK
ncbi:MAG: DUF4340 domain-containing protein [Mariniphaga sp.]